MSSATNSIFAPSTMKSWMAVPSQWTCSRNAFKTGSRSRNLPQHPPRQNERPQRVSAATHRLFRRTRLCVDKVVLVGLYERLHKLGCNQAHIMALLPQRASEKMRSGTCLHPDQRRLHVRGVRQQLPLGELLPHQHLAGCAKCDQVKRRLAKIDANRNYLHIDDPPP